MAAATPSGTVPGSMSANRTKTEALERARLHFGDALADRDRASRSRRRQLDEAQAIPDRDEAVGGGEHGDEYGAGQLSRVAGEHGLEHGCQDKIRIKRLRPVAV
jgi:hypothetical protein